MSTFAEEALSCLFGSPRTDIGLAQGAPMYRVPKRESLLLLLYPWVLPWGEGGALPGGGEGVMRWAKKLKVTPVCPNIDATCTSGRGRMNATGAGGGRTVRPPIPTPG